MLTIIFDFIYKLLISLPGTTSKITHLSSLYRNYKYGVPIFILFLYHAYNLGFYKKIDYGYNMKFNVFIGKLPWLILW